MAIEKNLELVKSGFANGISTQLATKRILFGPDARLTDVEKQEIIDELTIYINYVNTQEITLHTIEKQKEDFKNTYFTKDNKDMALK